MEWVDRMNAVIDYVEDHLCDDISPEEISRIILSPYSVFQRAFAQIAGISLSEYIRRRRLTNAVSEIQNSNLKIIDIALKYGYESADAFSVAFKRMHGAAPNRIRNSISQVKFFPRLHFTLSVKGVSEMDYKLIEKESFHVFGVRRKTPEPGGTWFIVKTDGSLERMQALASAGCPSLGLCFGFDEQGNNDYMCGFETASDDVPGYDMATCPPSSWLIFRATGSISTGILGSTWTRIYGEFMPQSSYRQRDLPTIERYITWDEAADQCDVEILIPVES